MTAVMHSAMMAHGVCWATFTMTEIMKIGTVTPLTRMEKTLKTRLIIGLVLAICGFIGMSSPAFATNSPGDCVPVAAVDQWYTWTGGPADDHPWPSENWQPDNGNHNGFPQDAGLYQRDKGHSGNSDWFYHAVTPAVVCAPEPTPTVTPTEPAPTPTATEPVCPDGVTTPGAHGCPPLPQCGDYDCVTPPPTATPVPTPTHRPHHQTPQPSKTAVVGTVDTHAKPPVDSTPHLAETGIPCWEWAAAGGLVLTGTGLVLVGRRKNADH